MRIIGLIGGTSWVSTLEYYRLINQTINKRLGGMHSAKILLYSVDQEEYNVDGDIDWAEVSTKLSAIAKTLEHAGADCLLIGANTLHIVSDKIQSAIQIPLIHIAEETSKEIRFRKMNQVGLLGTRTTMEHPYFKERLSRQEINTIVPPEEDRNFIKSTIYSELSKGILKKETRDRYIAITDDLIKRGAEGIILGCTEIPLLIKQENCQVPVFDTLTIHVKAAVEFALNDFQK
jgi:aspartate racemase